jgi:hypothetical protein
MKTAVSVIVLVLLGSLLVASDVRGGAGGLVLPTKTTGTSLTATIVTDVTGGSGTVGKGDTAIRVQKSSASAAVQFNSGYINSWGRGCIPEGPYDLQTGTRARFVGMMNGWVDDPKVLESLLLAYGDPNAAAITDTDYAACTTVTHKDGTVRQVLSFTAVIQFEK